jgi:23S rRNA (guanosine2251-2'-O)-methyltransferase
VVPFITVVNLATAIKQLKEAGVWVWGACGEAKTTVDKLELKGACALVLGAEGDGLRQLTRKLCDGLFSIAMQGRYVNSLNVSVACGIILYEAARQRV